MLTWTARRLILAFGASMALFDLVALLPGNPEIPGVGRFLFIVAVQVITVWGVWGRSGAAWALAVGFSGLYAVFFGLVGGPYETTFVISCFLALAALGFLLTPPVLSYVFRREQPV